MAHTTEAMAKERKHFPKTFLFWSDDETNFVGMMSKATGKSYVAVRTGMTTQISMMDFAVPRCSLVEILASGSYRIQDRDEATFFVISEYGIEIAPNRWPKLLFETIDLQNRFCEINVGGNMVKTDIKYGRGHGTVAPYTEEADSNEEVGIHLPGISFYRVEGDVREEREKLKGEREEREEKILNALMESGGTRSEGRMLGLKFDKIANLQIIGDEKKKKVAPKKRKPAAQEIKEWPEEESSDEGPKVELELGHEKTKPKPQRRSSEESTQREKVNKDTEQAKDNWRKLAVSIMKMKQIRDDAAGLKMVEPTHTGVFDSTMTSISFEPVYVPIFKMDSLAKEYTRIGYSLSKRACIVVAGETLTILPESA
ncbi:NS2 protein [Acado virus]|nr:NS2 protein [Acado virus]